MAFCQAHYLQKWYIAKKVSHEMKTNELKVKYFQKNLSNHITTFLSKYFFIVALLIVASQQSPEFKKKFDEFF